MTRLYPDLGLSRFRISHWDEATILWQRLAHVQKSISSPAYAHLRSILIDARRQAGLNQSDLADVLGKPQSYVSKYETGERRLDVLELITVAQAIGIDPVKVVKDLIRWKGPTGRQG